MDDVLGSGRSHGIPQNDFYGAVYRYVRDIVGRFCQKIRDLDVSFGMYQSHAKYVFNAMASHRRSLYKDRLDRIDLSNTTDAMYEGSNIVNAFASFLKPPSQNPHATIISLYMNSLADIMELMIGEGTITVVIRANEVCKLVLRHELLLGPADRDDTAYIWKLDDAVTWSQDNEVLYDHFYHTVLSYAGQSCSLVIKRPNTITKRWPFKLTEGDGFELQKGELTAYTQCRIEGTAL